MDVLDLELKLLTLRAGLAARTALAGPLPEQGAVVTFDVAFWDGVNAGADLLASSFEPGVVLDPGVHELVRTGRIGGFDVTIATWVTIGEESEIDTISIPTPARSVVWRPDLNRRPTPDPVDRPDEIPWLDALPAMISLPAVGRTRLARQLHQLADAGDAALAALLEQFDPSVRSIIARRRGVITRNPAFGEDDARACLQAELSDVLLRFASADRPKATILRTLRFALPNRLDAVLGQVDRAYTGSAENAEIRLFVRNHHQLEIMPEALRAQDSTLDKLVRTVGDRLGIRDRTQAEVRIRYAEDVQYSITASRSRRSAGTRGERLPDDWSPVKHRFSVFHICSALSHQTTVVSLDAPLGPDEESGALHELVASALEHGFAAVESRDLVTQLLTPSTDHRLEALALLVLRRTGEFSAVADILGLSDPDQARARAGDLLTGHLETTPPEVLAVIRAVMGGEDLTELERQVFALRAGLAGEELSWDEVCSRTEIALQYKSKTAAETRARAVLRRAKALVRGQAALTLPMDPQRRAELLCDRAEALTTRPFKLR